MQKALNIIYQRCTKLSIELDAVKTKAMWLKNTRFRSQAPSLPLHLGQRQLEYVQEYKYLGVLLDNRLRMKSFIETKLKVTRLRTNCVTRLRGLSRRSIRALWRGYVESYLVYGLVPIFDHLSKTLRRRLEGTYYASVRKVAGVLSCCPRDVALREAGMRPLEVRIAELQLNASAYADRPTRACYNTACDYKPTKNAMHIEKTFARWRSGYVYLRALMHKHKMTRSPLCRLCRAHNETMNHILFQCARVAPPLRWRLITTARRVYNMQPHEDVTREHIVGLSPGLLSGKKRTRQIWTLMDNLSDYLDALDIIG